MIDKINNWIIKRYINNCGDISDYDKVRISYSLDLVLGEGEKLMLLMLFFMLFEKTFFLMLALSVLMSLRIYIGGIHFSTRFRCFSFTLFFFICVYFFSSLIYVNKIIGLMICGVALVNICLCAPLASKHRILVSEKGKIKLKKRAMIVMIVWLVVYIMSSVGVSNIIIWTVTIQQLEILYYKMNLLRKDEKKY